MRPVAPAKAAESQNAFVGAVKAVMSGKSPVRRRKPIRLLNPGSTRNSALCQTGRHDYVTFKRDATKRNILKRNRRG